MSNSYQPNPACPWVHASDSRVSVAYIPAELSGNRNSVYIYGLLNGAPTWGQPFDMVLPGSVDHFAINPVLVTDMQGGGFNEGKGERGPFKFVCGDMWVDGLGLPENRHVCYVVTFDFGGTAPTPAPTPPPTSVKLFSITSQGTDANLNPYALIEYK